MELTRDFWLLLAKPLALMGKYRNSPRVLLAALIAGAACILNAVAAPLANILFSGGAYQVSFSAVGIALKLAASIVSLLLACLMFKLMAVIFKKPVSFKLIFSTWGLTFLPTLLCITAVEASEAGFYAFMGNTWLGLAICTFLMLLLAWKAIYFFMELTVVLSLKGVQTIWAVLLTGVVYFLILIMSFWVGLKVPML